jgi:hypothetical protein
MSDPRVIFVWRWDEAEKMLFCRCCSYLAATRESTRNLHLEESRKAKRWRNWTPEMVLESLDQVVSNFSLFKSGTGKLFL